MRSALFALAAAFPGLVACHASMMSNGSVMRSAISDARTENLLHRQRVTDASTIAVIDEEATRHQVAMSYVMGEMRSMMGGMTACDSTQGMFYMMGRVDTEMSTYVTNLRAAPTVGAARDLCTAHFDRMSQMLDDMDATLDGMNCAGMW